MSRRSKIPSLGGRDSQSGTSRSSVPDYGVRSTPLMRSTKKMLPSTSQKAYHRSSYFGASEHHGMKDTRPLNDKGYMKRCVNEIIGFLGEMNYSPKLNFKSLMSPSNKDYFRIVEFLFSLISDNYTMVGRQDEELMKILKDLNYPYILSKSTLSNVGAMTALPAALGALHWLMEIVKYSMSVQQDELSDMLYRNDKKQEYMFEYLRCTYLEFMSGKDEPYTLINEDFSKKFDDLNKEQLEDLEALRLRTKSMEKRKEEQLKIKEEMLTMEQQIPVLEKDKLHFKTYFEQIDEYCRSLEKKVESLKVKETDLDHQISSLQSEVKEIHSTVTGQELSVSDVEAIKREKTRIESEIKAMEEASKTIEEKCGEKQVEYSKIISKVDLQIADYSDVCKCSLLLPESGAAGGDSDSESVDYSLKPGRGAVERNMEKLTVIIRPKLLNDKSSLILSHGNVMQQRNSNFEKTEQLKEQVSDQKLTQKNLEEQLMNLEEDMTEQEKKYTRLEENANRGLEAIKDDIKRLKTVKSYSPDDIEAHSKREEAEVKQLEEKIEAEEKEYKSFLVQMSSKCLDQKEKMTASFKTFADEMKIREQEYITQLAGIKSELIEVHRSALEVQERINRMNE